MNFARGAPRLLNAAPDSMQFRRSRVVETLAGLQQRIVRRVDLLPIPAHPGIEEALDIIGHYHVETPGDAVNEFASAPAELDQLRGKDLFRSLRRTRRRTGRAPESLRLFYRNKIAWRRRSIRGDPKCVPP